jgi:hypothetical protein
MEAEHLHTRLKGLAERVRKMRNAQVAYFSLPRTVGDDTRKEFLKTSKNAEAEVDQYVKMLEYEKLV